MLASSLIDLSALWKIVVAALLVGVGLTGLFGETVRSAERLAVARRERHRATVALHGAIVALAATTGVTALAIGFLTLTHK